MFADAKVEKSGNQLIVRHGDDKECFVEFRKESQQQMAESERQGRPIFADIDFITIRFPGNKTTVVDKPVTDFDKQRFPGQWKQFQETGVVVQEGTPITEWPPLTKSQALEFKGMGIHTVEQLANIGDHLLTFFGARNYREEARAFLEKSKGFDAQLEKVQTENSQKLQALQKQMEESSAASASQLTELMAANALLMAKLNEKPDNLPAAEAKPAPKKRGPKPKPKAPAVESPNP